MATRRYFVVRPFGVKEGIEARQRTALGSGLLAESFASGLARKQLRLNQELGLLTENVVAALNNLPVSTKD